MAQLHTYVIERLMRWARWHKWSVDLVTSRPGPRRVRSQFYGIMSGRVPSDRGVVVDALRPCQVDAIEAGITDICINQLPVQLREAVHVDNLQEGTAEQKAQRIGISRRTLFYRLERAYGQLLGLFNDHEAGVTRADTDARNVEMATAAACVSAPASYSVSPGVELMLTAGQQTA